MMTEFAAPLPILARYAVMVDVGYIYAAAGELLFASSSRRDFRVDAVPLIQVITKHADEIIRGELLRVYWYDAAREWLRDAFWERVHREFGIGTGKSRG